MSSTSSGSDSNRNSVHNPSTDSQHLPKNRQSDLNERIRGSIVALATPMFADGQVDFDSLKHLVEWHIAAGTSAIVAVGTSGESATLTPAEHLQVIRFVVDCAAKRIPIIGGTGANSTSEAIELTQAAGDAGVDACLLVTPYYNKPTQEGLYLHHVAIAEATQVPQILYNVPGRTAVDMLPATIARLAEVDGIIGVKEATGDVARAPMIRDLVPDDFILLSGDDATFVDLIAAGATGNISVTANVAPEQMQAVCDAALVGDFDLARQLNEPLTALHQDLFVESNPIPVKWALQQMGKIPAGIRLPLTPLHADHHGKVQQAMIQAGIPVDAAN